MTALIQSVLSAPVPLALFVLGFLAMLVVVGVQAARAHKTMALAEELFTLAQDGRADEARIRARKAGRPIQPLLSVLGGEVEAPARRPMMYDAPWIILIALPLIVFVLYCLRALGNDHASLHVSTTLLAGTAILMPAALAASVAIFELSRRTTRFVRGTSIALLAQNVRADFEAERAEVIRRGGPAVSDPRGE